MRDAGRRGRDDAARVLTETRRSRKRLHQTLTYAGADRQQAIQLMWPGLTAALRDARIEGLPLQLTVELHEPSDLTRGLAVLALQFLVSEEVRLVGVCADPDCGRIFLDHSRNHTRRWCSSGDCGNRDRVRCYHAHPPQNG